MSWRSWAIYQPNKPQTYRNQRRWVHLCLIAFLGLVNLYISRFLVPEIEDAMRSLNENGFQAFFHGVTALELAISCVLGVLLFVYAIASLVLVLASIDALKDRLLDSGPAKPD